MTTLRFAAAAITLAAAFGSPSFAADVPYLDNRSDAESVIRSLYNAVNRHEYARAWDYFGDTKPAKDFASFVKGYETTEQVDVETGEASSDGAAGSIYYTVPVAIRATDKDGNAKVFAGCYTLRQVNAQIQEPPFNPIHIEKGALKPAEGELSEALPASCGDAPPPPKKDSALEQAKKAFATAYDGQCDEQFQDTEPDVFSIKYKDKDAAESDPERETRLFHFSCAAAAYNESSVYYIADDVMGVRQLQFAEPTLDIHYEKSDSDEKVESVTVIGFQTTGWAVNSDYDEEAKTIVTFNKWRGIGDASDSGTYLFRNGDFSLVQYDVDASYDGEENPQTVVDYNTAP